jgi:uncharacterized membrane protein YphA (DoxX/SURF4 family)
MMEPRSFGSYLQQILLALRMTSFGTNALKTELRSAVLSESQSTENNCSVVKSASCCVWRTVVALVVLRLCCGWHFFSEGIKKVEYDQSRGEWNLVFSAEPFLNGAVGPLANFYHSQAPTAHDWREHLAVPRQLDPAKSAKLSGWVASYVKRRQGEINSGKATDAQFADFSPAAGWGEQVRADWQETLKRFTDINSLTDEQRNEGEAIGTRFELYLADFLAEEALDIEAYQHELWRLEQAKQGPAHDEVPFEMARIEEMEINVDATPRKWVAQMKSMDAELADALREVIDNEDSALAGKVDAAVTDPEVRRLHRNDVIVTSVVISVGVCLLLGLFTRVAALAGALFLLSVMASQPPWVAGANSMFFYYQLVEFAALVFLAAVGAGRWAGLDFIIHGLWARRRGAQGA